MDSGPAFQLVQAGMTPFRSEELNQFVAARAWPKHVKCLLGLGERLWIAMSQNAAVVYHSGVRARW